MESHVMDFISRYYVIEKRVNDIYIRDIFEGSDLDTDMIDITPRVKFFWGRAKKITGINLYSKDYSHLLNIIRKVFRDIQTIDFYNFLTKNQKDDIILQLKDVKDEFPNLYGEQLQRIISENTTKDKD